MTGPALRLWRHGILGGHTRANRVSITLRQVLQLSVPRGVNVRRSSYTPSQSSIERTRRRDQDLSSGSLYRPSVSLIEEIPVHFRDGFADADAFEEACRRYVGDIDEAPSCSTISVL
eukprot:IDg17018t1